VQWIPNTVQYNNTGHAVVDTVELDQDDYDAILACMEVEALMSQKDGNPTKIVASRSGRSA
jgi:hypothetical protein